MCRKDFFVSDTVVYYSQGFSESSDDPKKSLSQVYCDKKSGENTYFYLCLYVYILLLSQSFIHNLTGVISGVSLTEQIELEFKLNLGKTDYRVQK